MVEAVAGLGVIFLGTRIKVGLTAPQVPFHLARFLNGSGLLVPTLHTYRHSQLIVVIPVSIVWCSEGLHQCLSVASLSLHFLGVSLMLFIPYVL